MEIEKFDAKYELHTIPEFVKHLNLNEVSLVQEQDEPIQSRQSTQSTQSSIFNTVRQETSGDESKTNETSYKIIKYNKKSLPKTTYSTCGLIRSVVVNASKKIVSFSPPKCISYEEFVEKNPFYDDNIIVEELIEGTMVQLFWDSYDCKWEIATKGSIGGYNMNTFTKVSFRDMFFDALKEAKLTLNNFNHKYCYSFVLQHPKNQIVFDIVKSQLYLLYVYNIHHVFNISDDTRDDISEEIDVQVCHLFDSPNNTTNNHKKLNLPNESTLKYPKKFGLKENLSHNHVYDYFYNNTHDINMIYSNMGLVIYNRLTGERCKIRNPYYEHLHNLHGRQSKLLYKYLISKSQNTVKQFVRFYQDETNHQYDPEIKNKIDSFKTKIQSFTNILLIHYIDCFINKTKPLNSYPPEYKSHMYNLHNMYLKELKPNKRTVNLIETIYYVNNLHPSKLVYSLIGKSKK